MKTIQFTPIVEAAMLVRLLRQVKAYPMRIVLDLEDGAQDLFVPANTPGIRAQARERVITLYEQHLDVLEAYHVGFRINAISTGDFAADVALLQRISKQKVVDCVVLTKVSSAVELCRSFEALATHAVNYRDIIPIVETVQGVAHLSEILAMARNIGIQQVVYGHYDYSIDAGHWPFLDHDQSAFWAWVEPIIGQFEENGVGYIHPPYPQLYNDQIFTQILLRLEGYCRYEPGILTINPGQSILCAQFNERAAQIEDTGVLCNSCEATPETLMQMAQQTYDNYTHYHREGLSFVLEPHSGRFIPPHEYLAAVQYLRRLNHD